jgi:hypothetical protein
MPDRNRPWLQLYKRNIQLSIVHSFRVCFRNISRVFTKVSAEVLAEVSAEVLAEVSAEVLVGGYTMIMFSLFILHLSRVKTYKQSILQNDSRMRPRQTPWQETLATTIQPNTYNYRLFILFGFVLDNFREYLAKVSAEVSAGGYTMIMFSLFILHLSRVKTYKQSILHTTTLG